MSQIATRNDVNSKCKGSMTSGVDCPTKTEINKTALVGVKGSYGDNECVKIEDLSIRFKNQIVFDKASLSIDNAGFYCIMGRNGCGKSTLLKAILSYVEYDGTIDVLCDGKNEKGFTEEET